VQQLMSADDHSRPPHSGHALRFALAFAAIYICWGSSFLATRVGVRDLPPFLFATARFICAGIIMLGVARIRRQRVAPQPAEWRRLAVPAIFGFLIANGVGVWTMQFVSSSKSALLNTIAPCWLVMLGSFGARAHRPGRLAIAGLIAGGCGAVMLIEPWETSARAALWPQLLILLGCLAWAISSVYQRNNISRLPVAAMIGWQMLIGGLMLGALGLASGEVARWHWQWRSLLPLSYLVIFASCLAHTAYAWLAPRTTPTSLGTYAYVNPAIATVLGWLVLNETLSIAQGAGMMLVLVSVMLINWSERLSAEPST
jgi:drug/metabolite transporter (DMT)-like permease